MAELRRKIAAEAEYVEKSLANLQEALNRPEKSTVELAAIATFLHNIYNGTENILKQILKHRNIDIANSKTWHKDLLEATIKSGIISEKLSDSLYEYLTFRHFFVHSYGFMLEQIHLQNLSENIFALWPEFISEIEQTCKHDLDNQ